MNSAGRARLMKATGRARLIKAADALWHSRPRLCWDPSLGAQGHSRGRLCDKFTLQRHSRGRLCRSLILFGVLSVFSFSRTPSACAAEARAQAENEATPAAAAAEKKASFFKTENKNVLVAIGVFACVFFGFLVQSKRGKSFYLRKIAGIAAIEEAVGRATEMGRPVVYVPGINEIEDIQTLASMAVLGHVSRMVADYDSSIIVPTRSPIVLSVCEETVKQSFAAAGRPDAYRPDNIRYLSGEQFAYTAGVDGIIMREKPAANLYLGAFFAESLILAETGFSSGAIQVAGTASILQLPFFITACDYTLIAEEFYAASAYLSRDPKVISAIKTSDCLKVGILAALIVGLVLASFPRINPDYLAALQGWF